MEKQGETSLALFYKTQIDVDGYVVKDSVATPIQIYSIDNSNEDVRYPKMHLDIILGGTTVINDIVDEELPEATEELRDSYKEMYKLKIINHYPEGLYEKFKNTKFTELFGEYNQGSGASEIKKRVITYQIQN